MKRRVLAVLVTIAGVGMALPSHGAETEVSYRARDGAVDESTYLGWRAFHSACHGCHGVDATGTAVAPNLVERIRNMSLAQFAAKVLTSYRIVLPTSEARADDSTALREQFLEEVRRRESGQIVMPAWEGDARTEPYLIDLYRYLRARGDGALGPGEPRQLAE